jgi:hypothetical protein
MSKSKDRKELALRIAISGHNSDELSKIGVSIEDDYLRRESRENLRMGLVSTIVNSWMKKFKQKRTEMELDIWKQDRQMAELERARTNKPEIEYPVDENDAGIFLPKGTITETV